MLPVTSQEELSIGVVRSKKDVNILNIMFFLSKRSFQETVKVFSSDPLQIVHGRSDSQRHSLNVYLKDRVVVYLKDRVVV